MYFNIQVLYSTKIRKLLLGTLILNVCFFILNCTSVFLSILLDFMTIRVKIPNCVLQYSICFMLNSKGFEGEYLKIQIFKLKGNKSL